MMPSHNSTSNSLKLKIILAAVFYNYLFFAIDTNTKKKVIRSGKTSAKNE